MAVSRLMAIGQYTTLRNNTQAKIPLQGEKKGIALGVPYVQTNTHSSEATSNVSQMAPLVSPQNPGGSNFTPVNVYPFVSSKLIGMSSWLKLLGPIMREPALVEELEGLSVSPQHVQGFMDWFNQQIRVKMYFGPHEPSEVPIGVKYHPTNMRVVEEFLAGYKLLSSDFKVPDLQKFIDYLFMFADVIPKK